MYEILSIFSYLSGLLKRDWEKKGRYAVRRTVVQTSVKKQKSRVKFLILCIDHAEEYANISNADVIIAKKKQTMCWKRNRRQ